MTRGATADSRPVFLFNLLLETGIKKAEAGRIKLDDIVPSDSQRATLHVKHHIRNVYKEWRIELAPHLLELFDRYRQQYKPQEQICECTTRNLQYILTDIGACAKVPFKLSFEVMRWTMAFRDYRAGSADERLREKLGLSKFSWYETGDKIRRIAAALDNG